MFRWPFAYQLADDQANIDPTFLASQNPQQVKKNVLAGFTKALLLPVTIVPMTVALSVNAITYGGTMALNAMSGTYGSSMIYGSSPKVGTTPTLSHEKGSPTATIRQNNSNLVVNGGAKESNLTSLPLTPNSSTMSYYSSKSTVRQTGFQMLLSIDTAMQLIQADRDCLKRIQTFQGYSKSNPTWTFCPLMFYLYISLSLSLLSIPLYNLLTCFFLCHSRLIWYESQRRH